MHEITVSVLLSRGVRGVANGFTDACTSCVELVCLSRWAEAEVTTLEEAAVLSELLGGFARALPALWGCCHAAGCQSSAVLPMRQRCSAGLVGQGALSDIIMDTCMKRLAKVSCLFLADGHKGWECAVTRCFCCVCGHMFCRTR